MYLLISSLSLPDHLAAAASNSLSLRSLITLYGCKIFTCKIIDTRCIPQVRRMHGDHQLYSLLRPIVGYFSLATTVQPYALCIHFYLQGNSRLHWMVYWFRNRKPRYSHFNICTEEGLMSVLFISKPSMHAASPQNFIWFSSGHIPIYLNCVLVASQILPPPSDPMRRE